MTRVTVFDRAVAFVLAWEGEWSTDPRGGRTRWGIAEAFHPGIDLDHLTREDAVGIYHTEYWTPIHGADLPPALAMVLFDTAVQHGVGTAVGMLQAVLGVQPIDQRMGPQTVARATNAVIPDVLVDLLARRAVVYARLAAATVYLKGWMRRLFAVHQAALAERNGI